jgi:hypothetical protein
MRFALRVRTFGRAMLENGKAALPVGGFAKRLSRLDNKGS